MRCPRDTTELSKSEDGDVYSCTTCGGMFFTRGELDRLAEPHEGDLEFSTVDLDDFTHPDIYPAGDCPACGERMEKVEFNIYTGIILDYCPSCGGFWLDAGELDRINGEVRELNEADEDVPDPPMLWFAKALWTIVS